MPVKPEPFVLLCQNCGWRKTIALQSDVIMPGQMPDYCPQCHEKLTKKRASWLQKLIVESRAKLRR